MARVYALCAVLFFVAAPALALGRPVEDGGNPPIVASVANTILAQSVAQPSAAQSTTTTTATPLDTSSVSNPAVTVTPTAAPAATKYSPVTIPYGEWISQVLSWVLGIAGIVVSGLISVHFPAVAKQWNVNQIIQNAANYGVAATSGALAGKAASVQISNQVLEQAVAYVVTNAPAYAKDLGVTLRPKIIARLGALGVLPADFTAT